MQKHTVNISIRDQIIKETHKNKYEEAKGNIKIHKIDADTGKSVSRVCYQLKADDGTIIAEKSTGSDGYVYFDDLPLGKYSYTEKSAPEGYVLDETAYSVNITKRGQSISHTRENKFQPPKGSISVHKCDSGGNNLQGVLFELLSSDDGGQSFKSLGTAATDRSGKVTFRELEISPVYRLVEKKTLPGLSLLPEPVYDGKLDENSDLSFTVNNTAIVSLPFTGGNNFNYIPEMALVLCAGFSFIFFRLRRIKNEKDF